MLETLPGHGLDDIRVIGWSHLEDGVLCFRPWLWSLYLDVGGRHIELTVHEQGEWLGVEAVSSPRIEAEAEADDTLTLSSVAELLFRDHLSTNTIVEVIAFDPFEPIRAGQARCGGLGLELGNGQYLFFDPTYVFGIKVGGKEQEQAWRADRWREGPLETRRWAIGPGR